MASSSGRAQHIPFWNRLSTRLSLLILLIVLTLAGATAILVVRGFSRLNAEAESAVSAQLETPEGNRALRSVGVTPTAELSDILRGTIVNLIAVFLLTLVAATVFSRTLLTEPIDSLVGATQEVASGNLGVTLPVTSSSELGLLASTFNQMSTSLESRTQELVRANQALRQSEAQLEQRVLERTSELAALLRISNTTALTLELIPLLESIFDNLSEVTPYRAAAVFEAQGGQLQVIAKRGRLENSSGPQHLDALRARETRVSEKEGLLQYSVPLIVGDQAKGILALETAPPDSEERRRLIAAFANQAGVALENAKLYDEVQEKAAYEERQHLARELHDSVSQALYSIVLGSHAARKQLERDPQAATGALDYVQNLAEAGLAEMRALIFELRPEILEREGLVAALRKQAEAAEVRHQLKVQFDAEEEPPLSFSAKQALFRVVQEALHNVVKHARAGHIHIRLWQADGVHLRFEDDGQGFVLQEDYPGHLGLKSMRERIAALGGRFTLESSPGKGTRIEVEVARHA